MFTQKKLIIDIFSLIFHTVCISFFLVHDLEPEGEEHRKKVKLQTTKINKVLLVKTAER